MRKRLLLLFAATCLSLAFGDPITCMPDTAAHYIANRSCMESPFILKGFSWSSTSGPDYVQITPDQVWLSPPVDGTFGLGFGAVPGNPNPFNIGPHQKVFATLDYIIDPRPPILKGASLVLNANSPTGGGFAIVTAYVCPIATGLPVCPPGELPPLVVQDFGHGDPRNVFFATEDFPNATNFVDVRITIDLQANNGTSEIAGAVFGTNAIPEPASAGLAAAACGILLVFRRRLRRF